MIIPRIMFVTEDIIEADIWRAFVTRTLLDTEPQKAPITASV